MTSVLVGCSHGTGDAAGRRAVAELLRAVGTLRPGLEVRAAYVDVQAPLLPEALAALPERDVVVVPLLLSRGFHVSQDIPAALAAHGRARASLPLGPDPALADLLAARLDAAGATAEDAIVLAAAGSSDPAAVDDVARMAALLQERLGAPVTYAFASAAEPRVEDEVARLAGEGRRVALAAYLLAPGHFHARLAATGAAVVTEPLAPDPLLAELVLRRYDATC